MRPHLSSKNFTASITDEVGPQTDPGPSPGRLAEASKLFVPYTNHSPFTVKAGGATAAPACEEETFGMMLQGFPIIVLTDGPAPGSGN